MSSSFKSAGPKDTARFAADLAASLNAPFTITLSGDLGAGKTEFARAFITAALGVDVEVTSPTFNICNVYEAGGKTIYHFDLYRLKHESELLELGIEEAISTGICLIEWPEIASNILPEDTLKITFQFNSDNPNSRTLEIEK